MSDTKALKSDAGQNSILSEITEPSQPNNANGLTPAAGTENGVASATENPQVQNSIAQHAESTATKSTKDQTADVLAKDINASEIVNESLPANPIPLEAVTVTEATKEKVDEPGTPKISENESQRNEQSELKACEILQTSIGAGDTCSVRKHDEIANAQKADKEIADETSAPKGESPLAEDLVKSNEVMISKLKQEVEKRSEERDSYRKKLESTEKKLAALQMSYDTLMQGEGDEVMLRRMVDQLKGKLIETSLQLEAKIRTAANQEKQINALNIQVNSLKEVESLTRSLLQIRNMEVKHLQTEVDSMEVRITEERERYNTMINKMDGAVKLNADLKKEYETQLCLFRDLREKYEEKVALLTREKEALENSTQAAPK
ncbi:uncharacterized protein LOC143366137 isoform X1 [Andrena cerasifolii]|uniref:uncharacterized protein LOC143366137 isoform X1 n=1 Tax=Andrena cerasifolii TaxID=2819439 RepID=UPI0040384AE8